MNSSTDLDSTTSVPKSLKSNEDWWGLVFKPNFTITECQQILNIPDDKSESSLSLPSDDINSVKEVREIANDIEKDKNIYRRVWRKNRFNEAVEKCVSENNLTALEVFNNGFICHESSTQTDRCIWDTKELAIIRSCVKDFKYKNRKLDAIVKELTLRNEELSTKNQLLEKRLEKKNNILNEALKANERFHILTDTLSSQLDECKQRNKSIITQKSSIFDENINIQNKIADLERDILEKEATIRKQRAILDRNESHCKGIIDNCISSLEGKHKKDINKLETQLDEVAKALKKESYSHRATQKGYQQLLKHFSEASTAAAAAPDLRAIKYIDTS